MSTSPENDLFFVAEWGAVLSPLQDILLLVEGTPGSVTFPVETVLKLHQDNPGSVFEFAHTHPPEHTTLSDTDKKMLKGWALAIHPWPVRMSIITSMERDGRIDFIYKRFICTLEPKETWDRSKPREYSILTEQVSHPEIDFVDELTLRSYRKIDTGLKA